EQLVDALQPVALGLAEALRGRLGLFPSDIKVSSNHRAKTPSGPIWDALAHDWVCLDQLAERTGLTTPELSSMLLIMELEGNITVSDGRYARNT
ncbi:MAG: DNA-protecting protein DprA, partial [Arenimonas sp.]